MTGQGSLSSSLASSIKLETIKLCVLLENHIIISHSAQLLAAIACQAIIDSINKVNWSYLSVADSRQPGAAGSSICAMSCSTWALPVGIVSKGYWQTVLLVPVGLWSVPV